MSKDILETMSTQEQRNPNPDNTGKKLKERISPFSRCKMLGYVLDVNFKLCFRLLNSSYYVYVLFFLFQVTKLSTVKTV